MMKHDGLAWEKVAAATKLSDSSSAPAPVEELLRAFLAEAGTKALKASELEAAATKLLDAWQIKGRQSTT